VVEGDGLENRSAKAPGVRIPPPPPTKAAIEGAPRIQSASGVWPLRGLPNDAKLLPSIAGMNHFRDARPHSQTTEE
jgi:hypothetical protein